MFVHISINTHGCKAHFWTDVLCSLGPFGAKDSESEYYQLAESLEKKLVRSNVLSYQNMFEYPVWNVPKRRFIWIPTHRYWRSGRKVLSSQLSDFNPAMSSTEIWCTQFHMKNLPMFWELSFHIYIYIFIYIYIYIYIQYIYTIPNTYMHLHLNTLFF